MIPVPKDAIDEIGRLAAEVSRLHEIVCEQDDMIAELTEQVDYLVGGNEELMGFLNASRDRVADLEEALRPFARVCDIIPVDDGDAAVQTVVYGTISLSAGQFRAARAVFQGDVPEEGDRG